jgi:PAS domain S-box-containing protein
VASCQAALDSGADRWIEQYRHKRIDDSYAYIIDRGYIARDASGKATRMIGAMLDITEQKQAMEEVSAQRKLLRTLFDTTPYMLVYKNPDSVYQMVNRSFCDFLSKKEEDIIGHTDLELFPRDEAHMYRRDDIHVMESGNPQVQMEYVTGARGKRMLQVAKTPAFDAAHNCIGILCSVREVNDSSTQT